MAGTAKSEARRGAVPVWSWRNRIGIACIAVLHLGALYALLTTEYGPFAITLSLLAWLFANCLVLLILPRPGIAAALSLMATVVLIAFSRFKFDILQLSVTFLDFLIIDRNDRRTTSRSSPRATAPRRPVRTPHHFLPRGDSPRASPQCRSCRAAAAARP